MALSKLPLDTLTRLAPGYVYDQRDYTSTISWSTMLNDSKQTGYRQPGCVLTAKFVTHGYFHVRRRDNGCIDTVEKTPKMESFTPSVTYYFTDFGPLTSQHTGDSWIAHYGRSVRMHERSVRNAFEPRYVPRWPRKHGLRLHAEKEPMEIFTTGRLRRSRYVQGYTSD